MECGLATAPQVLSTVAEGKSCPRCAGRLRSRNVDALHLIECAQCAGLWLAPGVLEAICDESERKSLVQQFLAQLGNEAEEVSPLPGPMYLACALCDERMHRRNFGGTSGVVIDTCKDHGLWLDHGELTRILAYVRRGGLEEARERATARRTRELARAADARPYSGDFERDLFAPAHDGLELCAVVRWLSEGLSAWTRTAK